MTVIEMVHQYLEQNGFDGLYAADSNCACLKDDLAPCGQIGEDCAAGYKRDGCDCGEGHDFHVDPEKP